MKVTKETQKLRDFEAGLLKMYQSFVRTVVRCGGGKKSRSQRGKGGRRLGSRSSVCARFSRGCRISTFEQTSSRHSCLTSGSRTAPPQRRWLTPSRVPFARIRLVI